MAQHSGLWVSGGSRGVAEHIDIISFWVGGCQVDTRMLLSFSYDFAHGPDFDAHVSAIFLDRFIENVHRH